MSAKRGRPKGSTIKGDARHLDAVADLMVCNPELKKTPAISKIVQKEFLQPNWEAAERRLLRKWNETTADRTEAAKERLAEERQTRSVAGRLPSGALFPKTTDVFAALGVVHTMSKQMQDLLIDPPALGFLRKHTDEAQRMSDRLAWKLGAPSLAAKEIQRMSDRLDPPDPPFMRQIREQSELMKKAFGLGQLGEHKKVGGNVIWPFHRF